MKKLFTASFLLIVLSLSSMTVFAHSGHLSKESIHSFLHVEHIIVLAAFGLVVFALKLLRKK
mgnify:CR=1 FL=1